MTEPLSAKDKGNPVINLLVMCVPMSMKTDNDANNSHIENYLFPRHFPRNDNWIVGYWLSTYEG